MAVAPEDLLEPNGDISPDWFPGKSAEEIDTLLGVYIADGVAHLPADLSGEQADIATTAWAMARAARNVYMRLSNTPATFTLQGEGSQSIIGEQIRAFKTMAEKFEADFAAFAPEQAAPDEAPSQAILNRYVF